MTRENWSIIRDTLSDDIRSRRLSAGDQLPTETQLADRFAIGRHSVRRALEALARDGKVSIEQGRGTFVADAPRLTYQIGKGLRPVFPGQNLIASVGGVIHVQRILSDQP